jgi:hypothetical protein
MKQVTLDVYTIDELDERVQSRLYEKWVANILDYPWESEALHSIKTFCDYFDCTLRKYEISAYDYDFSFHCEDVDGDEMKEMVESNLAYMKKQSDDDDFELTGYCLDGELLSNIYSYLAGKKGYSCYRDLMHDCLTDGFHAVMKDMEDLQSFQRFIEDCQENEQTFTEDGVMI